jgi:PBP1b-binding outer membrane lipoprotein LpoB
MRESIIMLIVLIFFNSCSVSPEEKAQDNVKKYLMGNMNDPKSYESVSFGKLDSMFSSFDESEEGIELIKQEKELSDKLNELDEKINHTQSLSELSEIEKSGKIIIEKRKNIIDLKFEKSLSYKGEFIGFELKHSFRGKNKMGGLVLENSTFILDKNLDVKNTY